MDSAEERAPAPAPGRGRSLRSGLVAGGLAFGLTLAGLGIAAAQTATTQPGTPGSGTTEPAPDDREGRPGPFERHVVRGGAFMGPHKGMFFGMGPGIRSEFVVPGPDGGYRTMAQQFGEVTSVSATSVTVRSEDGFSRTYSVDDDTMVNAGNEGIDDVEQGDQVSVTAVVEGDRARAMDIHDATQMRRIHGRWGPRHDRVKPAPAPSGEGS